jgi:predicted Zn-ribbon and HTH transcriptional regulator
MLRTITGWFRSKPKKLAYKTTMVCLEHECGYIWEASCISNPCPKCASNTVIPANKWGFETKGMLRLGKVGGYEK